MKKVNKAKGFTLVELLVVIAILAILATVSTISYFAFTSKAKESNDISLTAQMNTVLQANEAVDGKAKTMSQALRTLSDAGLDITKLTPTSQGYSYVYDSDSGKMLLLDKDRKIIAPEDAVDTSTIDTFAIVRTEEELTSWANANYGVYLANGYTGTTELTALTSVDVGDPNINTLTINDETSTENVLINAELDSLNLNVPEASVNLYGNITTANASTANHSLHVFGHIQQLNVTGGKVVVENAGEVNTIDASNSNKNIEITKTDGGSIGAVIASESNDNVVIDSNIVKVDSDSVAQGFAGGVGTENAPYLISNEEEFRNIDTLSNNASTNDFYFLQTDDITISSDSNNATCIEYFSGIYNGNGFKINYNYVNSDNFVNTLFYNVRSAEIDNLSVNFLPSNDANGQAAIIVMEGQSVIFNNVDVYGDLKYASSGRNQSPYIYTVDKTSFVDCDVYCNIYTETYNSVFYGYPMSGQTISLTNCTFYGEIVGDKVSLLFANDTQYNAKNTLVNISNVKNEGIVLGYTNAALVFATGMKDSQVDSLASKIISNSNVKVLSKLENLDISLQGENLSITPATNAEVSYYKVEMKQYVTWYYPSGESYGIGTTMVGFSKTISSGSIETLDLKYYEFRQLNNDLNQSFIPSNTLKYTLNNDEYTIVDSDFDDNFEIVESNGQRYYLLKTNVIGLNNNEYIVISNPKPSIKLYAYDSNNDLLGLIEK